MSFYFYDWVTKLQDVFVWKML